MTFLLFEKQILKRALLEKQGRCLDFWIAGFHGEEAQQRAEPDDWSCTQGGQCLEFQKLMVLSFKHQSVCGACYFVAWVKIL